MQIGISQLIAPNLDMETFFDTAANAGYDVVELAMRAKGALTGEATDEDLQETVTLSQKYGIPISSMTIGHCSGNLLDSGEAQQRSLQETVFGLQAAARLGASVALHTLGRLSADLYYDDAYRNAVTALKELAPVAESLGVTLAFEFVWNGFLFSPLEVRRFLDEIGSDHVGFYFDPGNMAVFQFPQHWVRILGSRIKRVHLKDWKGRALNGGWTPLLEGEVDFAAVMRELHVAGYTGPLISEVAESLASFADTAQTMRRIAAM